MRRPLADHPPNRLARYVVALLVALAPSLLGPRAASAHALLVQANPAPDSVIARAPAVASFVFSEALNLALTRVQITDAGGQSLTTDPGHLASGHGGTLWLLSLPTVRPGVYSVFWTSESATDGHVRSSFYTFRVAATGGAAGLGAAPAATTTGRGFGAILDGGSAVTALFTWLGFLAQSLWLGALIVEVAVLVPARRARQTPQARLAWAAAPRLCWTVRAALVLTLCALVGEIVSLATQAGGGDWGAALSGVTLRGLFSSQNGHVLLARLALLLAVFLVAGRVGIPTAVALVDAPRQRPRRSTQALGIVAARPLPLMLRWEVGRAPLALGAVAYLLLVALSGHAADVTPGLLAYPIDGLHLLCTAAWAGGIATLAIAVLPARSTLAPAERAAAVLPLLDRFSPVAYLAVGVLALSGLYNAVVHVGAPATLGGTTYGQLLILKLGLVGVLVLLSASHVYRLRPRIARAQERAAHDAHDADAAAVVHEGLATLAGRLRIESGVGAAILLATALMTQTLPAPAPPTTASTAPTAPTAPATPIIPPSIDGTAATGDLRARLTITPPAVGTALFTLLVWEQGTPITENTGAAIIHLYPANRPDRYTTLTPTGRGTRFAERGSLPLDGTWRADVSVRTATVNDYRTLPFTFTVGPGAGFLAPGVRGLVTLRIAPGRVGVPNTVTIAGVRARGVQLLSESLDMPMGRLPYTATPLGDGRWQARNVYPLMNGRWALTVQVQDGGSAGRGRLLRRFVYFVPLRGTVRLLSAGTAAPARARASTTAAPSAVRWTGLPASAVVSFADNGLVYVPGLATLVHVGSQNHSVTLAPDGTLWVMDYAGGRVAVLDPRTGRTIARITVGIAPAHAVFTPDGRRAYVSNLLSNDVSVVDVRARRVVTTISVQPGLQPHALAISPDGREVWAPCGLGGGIWVIDTRTYKVARLIPTGGFPHAVTFSPDGRTAYLVDASPGKDSGLFVIDRATGHIRARIAVGTGSAMVVAGRDGRRVYVTGQGGGVLTVIDAATLKIVTRVPVGTAPHGLVVTPDGRLLYVAANTSRQVAVVDTATDRVVATVPVPGTADELALWPSVQGAPGVRRLQGVTTPAAPARWAAVPGPRTIVHALRRAPWGALYAGVSGGVYSSRDGGVSWCPVGHGFPATEAWGVAAVHQAHGDRVLAAAEDGSIYRLALGRDTDRWTGVRVGTAAYSVFGIPGSDVALAGSDHGILRSSDGGRSWTLVARVRGDNVAVTSFARDPERGTLYAGVAGGASALRVSRDGGRTWQAAPGSPPPSIEALLATPGRLYAGVMGGPGAPGIYAGVGHGFVSLARGLPRQADGMTVATTGSQTGAGEDGLLLGTMGVGVYRRAGSGWTRLGRGPGDGVVTALLVLPGRPPVALAGTDSGLYRAPLP